MVQLEVIVMLYWTKYKIIDRCDDFLIVWNTRTSADIIIDGNIAPIIKSVEKGEWDETCDEELKHLLTDNETLINEHQYNTEELSVKNFRDFVVFDDSFQCFFYSPFSLTMNCGLCSREPNSGLRVSVRSLSLRPAAF